MPSQQILTKLIKLAETHGWAIQGVFAREDDPNPEPGFAYTVGLFQKELPDLLVVGLPYTVAGHFLNAIAAKMVNDGLRLADGDLVHEVASLPLKVRSIDTRAAAQYAYFGFDMAAEYSKMPTYLQVVFPDERGLFEGDPGVEQKWVDMQKLKKPEKPLRKLH